MPKKIINDIIISKRSIRQIPVSPEKKAPILPRLKLKATWQRKPLNPKFVIWSIAVICILALFFGVSLIFSSATLIIKPRMAPVTFTGDVYTAKVSSAGNTELVFEVLNVKQNLSETVSATEEKQVNLKATGKIMIYNTYSTAPQRLINNTRFESTNGMIYRINTSVIVPGYTKVNGQIIPGSISATVFADQPGDKYNQKISDLAGDFKIPGFKGDQRYDKFYGRLKEDIQGGFTGRQRIVAEDVRKGAENLLKEKLKEQLLKELYAIKPANYLVFKEGYSVDYQNMADTAVDNDKVKINLEGNLHGIVFNSLKLSQFLAQKKNILIDGLPTEFIPADNLVATLTGADSTGLWKNTTLQLKLTGEAVIKWQYDSEALKKDLAGKKEADLISLAAKYKNSVSSIKVIFKPVWTRYFPDNLNKIRIEEEI